MKQLEAFAGANHVPIGYLFLPEPPAEDLPIPDMRTLGGGELARPSPDLLDVLYLCQQRGLDAEKAVSMIVNGFCKEVFRELPMEFAVEAGKLLEVSLEGSVG